MVLDRLALGVLVLSLTLGADPVAAQTDELDAYWAEVSRTVAEGDYEGYAALYHADAVLVSDGAGMSAPIADALAEWKQGFLDTRDGKMTAAVTFRFSERFLSARTAYETGIFRYVSAQAGGEPQVALVHFDALLVKKGEWRMLMERQRTAATEAEWAALE